MGKEIKTFIEKKPTFIGNPTVVICRLSDDDDYKIACKLESKIIKQDKYFDKLFNTCQFALDNIGKSFSEQAEVKARLKHILELSK